MTIGDAAKSLGRYRPFTLLVAPVLAVVVILPGKPGPKQNSASSVQTGNKAGIKSGAVGDAAAGDTTVDTAAATGDTTAVGATGGAAAAGAAAPKPGAAKAGTAGAPAGGGAAGGGGEAAAAT